MGPLSTCLQRPWKIKKGHDASIDVFSYGVVSIFTLCQTFPWQLLAPNYCDGQRYIARTELERRERYMKMIYSQLREQHPILQMIKSCLGIRPEYRPRISEVLCLLEQARAENRDEQTEMNKLELLQALQTHPWDHPSSQARNCVLCMCTCIVMCFIQDYA